MSYKPKPSERAAMGVYGLIAETEQLAQQGDYLPQSKYRERIAAIIARETGCDKPDPACEIVRRLNAWSRVTTTGVFVGDTLREIIEDAAALHAAGGKDNGTD